MCDTIICLLLRMIAPKLSYAERGRVFFSDTSNNKHISASVALCMGKNGLGYEESTFYRIIPGLML